MISLVSKETLVVTDTAMRLEEAVLLSLLLLEASAAPRKKRDIDAVDYEHPHHVVSFFDSFFSFFGGGSDSSPITRTQVESVFWVYIQELHCIQIPNMKNKS